jgi:hypothetical protein
MALAELVNDPVHQSLLAPSTTAAMARAGSRALTAGIRPLLDPVFELAADQGLLREGVTPEDASRWLRIVASGLLCSPEVLPKRAELVRLLELMLVPALLAPEPRARRVRPGTTPHARSRTRGGSPSSSGSPPSDASPSAGRLPS